MQTRTAFVLIASFFAAAAVFGAESTCADCHRSNPDLPSYPHIEDWQASVHGHSQVGCEQCHGGDATTFRKFLAHRGMVRAVDPQGPLHSTNLPATCGKCHAAVYSAFSASSHGERVAVGNDQVPTCTSCHGPLALQGLGPNGLQVACARCHDGDSEWPNPEISVGGEALTTYREAAKQLKRSRSRVRKVRDPAQRHDLEAAVHAATGTLAEAIEHGHAMDLTGMLEQSRIAQQQIDELLAAIPRR